MLCNDLAGAVGRADHWNRQALADIIECISDLAPRRSWGSVESVKNWLNDQSGCRTKWVEQFKKDFVIKTLTEV